MPENTNLQAEAEKLATQAEVGGGRTAARPAGSLNAASGLQPGSSSPNNAPIGGDAGRVGAPTGLSERAGTLSGNVTNDSMPEGGATGDQMAPDTLAPGAPE